MKVGFHQGFVLTPLLFAVVLDLAAIAGIRDGWMMLREIFVISSIQSSLARDESLSVFRLCQ